MFGSTVSGLMEATRSMVIHTADYGTEFALPRVQPVKIKSLLPWVSFRSPESSTEGVAAGVGDDDFQAVEEPADPLEERIAVNRAIEAPGLLHIMHNAADHVLENMPLISDAVVPLSEVCDLLSHEHSRSRFLATCLDNTPLGEQCTKQIKEFKARINRKRWGTVAFGFKSILQIRFVLNRYWNLRKYCEGTSVTYEKISSETDASSVGPKLHLIDESIASINWWAAMITGDFVMKMIRQAFEWVEGWQEQIIIYWFARAAPRGAPLPPRFHPLSPGVNHPSGRPLNY